MRRQTVTLMENRIHLEGKMTISSLGRISDCKHCWTQYVSLAFLIIHFRHCDIRRWLLNRLVCTNDSFSLAGLDSEGAEHRLIQVKYIQRYVTIKYTF